MQRLPDGSVVLSATDATSFLACEHLAEQRRRLAMGERTPPPKLPDAHAELAFRKGDEHEAVQRDRLAEQLGGIVDLEGRAVAGSRPELEAGAERTLAAMRAGAPLLYQAELSDGRWRGIADFVRRVETPSPVLGAWSYEVVDTKLSKHVKAQHVHQLSLYSRLLGERQGVAPEHAYVLLGTGEEVAIRLADYAALHRRVVARVEALAASGGRPTEPEPVAHCGFCDYQLECRRHWRQVDHLSLVANIRRTHRARLVAADVPTVKALAVAPEALEVEGIDEDRYALLHHQAALQVDQRTTGEPRHRHLEPERARGYARLPEPDAGDVFFDLEGDPFVGPDGVEYLWGWSTAAGYDHVWAHHEEAERAALEHFVDWVVARRTAHPGLHVFHYAPHEESKLKGLALKYGTREAEVDDLLRDGVLVDLLQVVRQGLQVGEESYSLKALERHHGFTRLETSVREGGGSIVTYEEWLETEDDGLLEAIRAYNEEDCVSTQRLRDWLLTTMRPEAAAEFGVDFAELRDPEPDPDRPLSDEALARQALVERLQEGLPEEAENDDAEKAERRLLADLLQYHQREDKPGWWRWFELCEMTSVELVEERDAIGELRPDPSHWGVPVKRSLEYAFTFPPQEHKVGDGYFDPVTQTNVRGEIEEERVLVLVGKGKPPPDIKALIGGKPFETKAMRTTLDELGEVCLSGEGLPPAVRSLLRREAPRARAGRTFDCGSCTVDDLVRTALDLDGSHLVVQGPPGTGKTYSGARMIVAAMQDGRRVGATAQSHAAIHNLLRAVEHHAADIGWSFSGVYKGHNYESEHGLIEEVDGNDDVLPEHQLVAGTAWLHARESLRGELDLLFIDEAGQFALANAVAATTAASSVVLLGDPQQLPQVVQAQHPNGSGASVLEHLLDGDDVVPSDRGAFLATTWRLHPDICAFVSERSYEGKLRSEPDCALRRVDAPGALHGAGLRVLPVAHEGRSQRSEEEADAIAAACRDLLAAGATVTGSDGRTVPMTPAAIKVVAAYNLAVQLIRSRVPEGVEVGTVDKFQGQEAPVVFYAMTCSSGEDVPRGLDFLFSRNRFNVAVSRAQALAVLVCAPRLLDADCRTLEAMALVDGACRFVELAEGRHPS